MKDQNDIAKVFLDAFHRIINLPDKWLDGQEGTTYNHVAVAELFCLISYLVKEKSVTPPLISPTVEGGIWMEFEHGKTLSGDDHWLTFDLVFDTSLNTFAVWASEMWLESNTVKEKQIIKCREDQPVDKLLCFFDMYEKAIKEFEARKGNTNEG